MNQTEFDAILDLHLQAFGAGEGPEITRLARSFLALPETISISVRRGGRIAANVLFTPFIFDDHPDAKCYLLAPCGVLPSCQGQGAGRELMETSIAHLKSIGAEAVFVLGVPGFYPRYGFAPTGKQTPYPELLTMPEAWMVLELTPGALAPLGGRTRAVAPFIPPALWDPSASG
jgi:predicted N-acetyltransferase YhbS